MKVSKKTFHLILKKEVLIKSTAVQELNVTRTRRSVTDDGMICLTSLTALSSLSIPFFNPPLGFRVMTHLPHLQELHVEMDNLLAGHDAALLVRIPTLRCLEISCLSISTDAVTCLASCSALTRLKLKAHISRAVTDAELAPLLFATQLHALELVSADVSDLVIRGMTALTRLTALSLYCCQFVTTEAITTLTALPTLRFVDVRKCSMMNYDVLESLVSSHGLVFSGMGMRENEMTWW